MRYCFVVAAAVLLSAACDQTRSKPGANTVSGQPKLAVAALPARPQHLVRPCEQRFIPIGTALTRAATDTITGQQCRIAESAPPAFRSLPLCFDLFSRDDARPVEVARPAESQSPARPCEQRFLPVGTALTRAALDTRTGQQCRTAENAPPAFRSLPMCSELSGRFPD
jgi:hypothetical protein